MTILNIQRDKSTWLLFIVTVLLSGLFAFANLSEFVTVGILKQTSGYPFGGEGPTPWFYKSAQLYATVNLITGLLFILTLFTGTWSFIKVQRRVLLIAFAVSLLHIVLQLLTGASCNRGRRAFAEQKNYYFTPRTKLKQQNQNTPAA
jgi:hypothetical protein